MPASASFYAPTVVGSSPKDAFRRKQVDVLAALKLVGEDGKLTDSAAAKLMDVAEDWFDAWRWYVSEAVTCENLYGGNQWGYWDDAKAQWIGNTLDVEPDRIRITVNVVKSVVDQAVSMLTGDAPIFRAAAGQPGVAAAAAKETAYALLDEVWREHNLDDLYRDVGRSAFITGTSFVLLEWDETAGPLQLVGHKKAQLDAGMIVAPPPESIVPPSPPIMPAGVSADGALVPPGDMGALPGADSSAVPNTGAPSNPAEALAAGPTGAAPAPPALPREPVYAPQGNLKYRMLMRDQVAYAPNARARGGQDGVGICIRWQESRNRLEEQFPDVEFPEADERNTNATGREERAQRTSLATNRGSSQEKADDDTLEVVVFYLRSRPDRRRGDCIMVCAGKVLYHGENDVYPTDKEIERGEQWPPENWPVFAFLADTRENCPVGRGRIVDAVPIQHAINGCYSKAIQHIGVIANVKYVLPAGMDFEPTDEPGQVARVAQRFWAMTGQNPVRMTTPPQMPEYERLAETLKRELEGVVGINASSMGASPTSDASGRLTQSLQQRDTSRIAPLKRSLDNQMARMQNYALRLFRTNATGERVLRVVGSDQSVAKQFFDVADLAAGTEVYSVNDNSISRDPQQRILQAGQVWDKVSQMQDPDHQTAYLELLRLPDLADWQQRRSPHQTAAIRLTQLLMLGDSELPPGMPPPVAGMPPGTPLPSPIDNAMIFKSELERVMCGGDYRARVKSEKFAPENMGTSPLEQRFMWSWTYYAQKAIASVPAAPSPAPPGAPGEPGKSKPPAKQAA